MGQFLFYFYFYSTNIGVTPDISVNFSQLGSKTIKIWQFWVVQFWSNLTKSLARPTQSKYSMTIRHI